MNRQPGTDRRGHRLLEQMRLRGARAARGFQHRALLHVGDGRGHTDQHPSARHPVHARALEQQPDHSLRDVEVGDGATAQWPDRHDVARRPADHLPRLVPHREHVLRTTVQRNDGRLIEDDSVAARVDKRVRRSEVDRKVARQVSSPLTPTGAGGATACRARALAGCARTRRCCVPLNSGAGCGATRS